MSDIIMNASCPYQQQQQEQEQELPHPTTDRVRRNSIMRIRLKNSSFHFEEDDHDINNNYDESNHSDSTKSGIVRTRSRSENDISNIGRHGHFISRSPLVAEFYPETGMLSYSMDINNNNNNGYHHGQLVKNPFSGQEDLFQESINDYCSMNYDDPINTSGSSPRLNWEGVTTIMLRNIPSRYCPKSLRRLIGNLGFANSMDFFYMPMDSVNYKNLGYAFINLITVHEVARFMEVFVGYRFDPSRGSEKVCEVCPARVQGFYHNVSHFQNSATRVSIPDEFKPIAIKNGEEIVIHSNLRRGRSNSSYNSKSKYNNRHTGYIDNNKLRSSHY